MTEAELIRELETLYQQAGAGPDDAFTVEELGDIMDLGEKAVRRRLRRVKQAGRLEAMFVMREALNGTVVRVPAYRLRPE